MIEVCIKYKTEVKQYYSLTPEEMCYLHSGEDRHKYIPPNITDWSYEVINKEKAEEEMNEYFYG